jgi:hypothetical protein
MNAQACNGCDALDYVGELNEAGVCNECSLDTAAAVKSHPRFKIGNEYAGTLEKYVFEQTPKSVFAAIAVSSLTCGGDYLEHATRRVVTEWDTLHTNGIVPQAVPAKLRRYIDKVPC